MTKGETADDDDGARGWAALRPGHLLALLGLTGFAVSQPLLSLAGENPTLFTFAEVRGSEVVAFAAVVALVPPLVLWAVVVVVGRVHRQAGDGLFLVLAGVLAGATAIQLAKSAGIEGPVLLAAVVVAAAVGFGAALARWPWVDQWVRFTSPLPVVALLLFLLATPSGQLVRSPTAAAARVDAFGAPPLVFVMLDELPTASLLGPDGAIDPVRFPNIASLADDATWYPNYTIMAPSTVRSVPNILTGREPSNDQPLWTEHPDSLFSLLAPTHELAVSETVTQLCGFQDCAFSGSEEATATESLSSRLGGTLGDIAGVWVDRVSPQNTGDPDLGQFQEDAVPLAGEATEAGFDDDFGDPDEVRARPGRLTDFLASLEPGDRPGLHYLHLMLPHQPWTFHPDGTQYALPDSDDPLELPDPPPEEPTDPGPVGPEVEAQDPDWSLAVIEQRHLLQASYTDRLVGEVLDRLDETGLYDDAVVVVTSDHGINFKRFPDQRGADEESVGAIGYVPLLVKGAGQREPRVDDSNLMAVDLLPTLADAIGIEVPWELDGHPAGSPEIAGRGGAKQMASLDGGFRGSIDGVIDYDLSARPGLEDRLVGPIAEDDATLGGLVDRVGATDLLGAELDALGPSPAPGSAAVIGLDELRAPTPGEPMLGAVGGLVDAPVDQGTLLVAIDGRIVTAAPLEPDGFFNTLMPPGALDRDGNELRLAVLADDEVLEIELG
ncbi:hypothetical protein BH23ACT2_BH23ACT2_25130 [soil metagenome]